MAAWGHVLEECMVVARGEPITAGLLLRAEDFAATVWWGIPAWALVLAEAIALGLLGVTWWFILKPRLSGGFLWRLP